MEKVRSEVKTVITRLLTDIVVNRLEVLSDHLLIGCSMT